jgi:hypothetical protein
MPKLAQGPTAGDKHHKKEIGVYHECLAADVEKDWAALDQDYKAEPRRCQLAADRGKTGCGQN